MSRRGTYYWKCDRAAAFYGTEARPERASALEGPLTDALEAFFQTPVALTPGTGQGNHLTWLANVRGETLFIRVEDGPEQDDHMEVETAVMNEVRNRGVSVPIVFGVDATRSRHPFAWQALEYLPFPDLNHFYKAGILNVSKTAFEIGAAIALWQSIQPLGFGPFDPGPWFSHKRLCGFHAAYATYFQLRLHEHLSFLGSRGFLSKSECDFISRLLEEHQSLLGINTGCLVHKDLALWNVLGTASEVKAFIDFDDAISGDPMDDLSLLACFHDAHFLEHALEGYTSRRSPPPEYRRRFWMHLIRNMLVKSVIRIGAGYFERDSSFFLIGSAGTGADFKAFTRARLFRALDGLQSEADLSYL
jgi:tRNA A-37 threonylcarbamoyl transferase component Bud32